MKLIAITLLSIIMASCSGGSGGSGGTGGSGGGGSGGGDRTNPPVTNNSTLTANTSNFNISLANINETKTKTIVITNNGSSSTNALSMSQTGQSQVSVNFSDCANKILSSGQSCSIILSLVSPNTGVFSKTVTVSGAGGTFSFSTNGYVYNTAEISYMIQKISEKQDALHSGSWDFLDSDLANNAFITHALAKADAYSSVALYTPNMDYTNATATLTVDKAFKFLAIDEAEKTLLVFDKNSGVTDYNTVQTKWSDTIYSKPKQLSPGLLAKLNDIYKIMYSSDMPNFTTLFSQYMDSRKIINVDGGNNVSGSTSSVSAQFAYLVDDKRWPSGYFIEDAMKEVSYLFESLKAQSRLSDSDTLARIFVKHWVDTLPDVQNLVHPLIGVKPDTYLPEINLKYNPTEFDYTSFQIPGNYPADPQNHTSNFNIQLSYVNDYQNHGYGCRNLAYTVLNLSYAYLNGNWNSTEKTQIENLVKDGIIEMKQSNDCKYNSTTKKYTSQVNSGGTFNNNNGIPIIAKIYSILPTTIISASEKADIYNQLIQELAVGGSIDLDSANGDPLIRAEALDYLMSLR